MHVDVLVAEIGSTTTMVNAFQNIIQRNLLSLDKVRASPRWRKEMLP